MKINQFSTSSLLIAVATAVILAIVASFLTFLSDLSASLLLAIGAIIGGIAVALSQRPSPAQTEPAELVTQTLYVGNLPYRANETAVRELFAEYGNVISVRLLKDKQTGKRRGFGFVEMSEEGAEAAIQALNDQEYQDRTLKVRPANNRKENSNE